MSNHAPLLRTHVFDLMLQMRAVSRAEDPWSKQELPFPCLRIKPCNLNQMNVWHSSPAHISTIKHRHVSFSLLQWNITDSETCHVMHWTCYQGSHRGFMLICLLFMKQNYGDNDRLVILYIEWKRKDRTPNVNGADDHAAKWRGISGWFKNCVCVNIPRDQLSIGLGLAVRTAQDDFRRHHLAVLACSSSESQRSSGGCPVKMDTHLCEPTEWTAGVPYLIYCRRNSDVLKKSRFT